MTVAGPGPVHNMVLSKIEDPGPFEMVFPFQATTAQRVLCTEPDPHRALVFGLFNRCFGSRCASKTDRNTG